MNGLEKITERIAADAQAQADQIQLEQLQMEIELLEYATSQENSVESAARLDEDILQSIVSLRASYAQGDGTQLQERVMEVKSAVLKRGYTYNDGLTSADLNARLKALREELGVLTRQSASATTRINAPEPGVFSSLVDGYESPPHPGERLSAHPFRPSGAH